MVKMRALKQFTHTTYGTQSQGDVFDVAPHHVAGFQEWKLAVPAGKPVKAPESAPTEADVLADLEAAGRKAPGGVVQTVTAAARNVMVGGRKK